MGVQLDHFAVVLLILRPDAPNLEEEAATRLQDAHLAHLADLHEAGHLIGAGPLSDPKFRGLIVLNVEPERARALEELDPAVLAGRFSVQVIPWSVPHGAVNYSRTRFPRSVSDLADE
jgi:uncharacterized protein YciI